MYQDTLEFNEYVTRTDPFQIFMDRIRDLRCQFRISDTEWTLALFHAVKDERADKFRTEFILNSINECYTISTDLYFEIYNLLGDYFLDRFAKDLTYQYPEYEEQHVSPHQMLNTLNNAVGNECWEKNLYFKPVSQHDLNDDVTNAVRDAIVPADIVQFCIGAKDLASKYSHIPHAKDVIAEANRVLNC